MLDLYNFKLQLKKTYLKIIASFIQFEFKI